MNSTTSATNESFACCRRPSHAQGHSQRRSIRHSPRPLPLLEAIEGLSLALNALQSSLGSTGISQSGGHVWPQRQPQQAIAMPWLDDAKAVAAPEASDELETEWVDDPWACPWDELSVVELRSLLR